MGRRRRLRRISSQVLLAVQHHDRPLLVHLQKVSLVSAYEMTEDLLKTDVHFIHTQPYRCSEADLLRARIQQQQGV